MKPLSLLCPASFNFVTRKVNLSSPPNAGGDGSNDVRRVKRGYTSHRYRVSFPEGIGGGDESLYIAGNAVEFRVPRIDGTCCMQAVPFGFPMLSLYLRTEAMSPILTVPQGTSSNSPSSMRNGRLTQTAHSNVALIKAPSADPGNFVHLRPIRWASGMKSPDLPLTAPV